MPHDGLLNAVTLYHGLACAGVFEDSLAFNRFSLMVERALWNESFSSDAEAMLAEVEEMLKNLGVIPFNETDLARKDHGLMRYAEVTLTQSKHHGENGR